MRYELYYWPSIPGRGEFVRLALEEAGADYVDVARERGKGQGVPALMQLMEAKSARPPFAPPFLKAGKLVIAQTANILLYLGGRHGLAPANEAGRLWANQLQLTLADLSDEAHDTHHPIASALYYEDQKEEAKRRSALFLKNRVPKFLGYFERVLDRRRRALPRRTARHLSRPVAVPRRRRAPLRLSQSARARDEEASAGRRAMQPGQRAAAHESLSRLAAAALLQRARSLPPLSRARHRGLIPRRDFARELPREAAELRARIIVARGKRAANRAASR